MAAGQTPPTPTTTGYSSVGSSNYHGLHVSFIHRPASWGTRVSYTLSKSMNDVGEFFFSGPIDPFDLSKDWARSDDDQRHRLPERGNPDLDRAGDNRVGALDARSAERAPCWRISAPPLQHPVGRDDGSGHGGRPVVDGAFIERNAGVGSEFSR